MNAKRLPVAIVCLAIGLLLTPWIWQRADGVSEYRGTLRFGIVQIGGESTGVVLDTGSEWYELAVPPEVAVQQPPEELDGRRVIVTGVLRVGRGIEVRERRIIHVQTLRRDDSG